MPSPHRSSPSPSKQHFPTLPERAKQENDPRLVAAARELRDRYLEQVEAGTYLPEPCGKYEVSRQLTANVEPIKAVALLAA